MKRINFMTILFEIIELAFIVFLPIPVWFKIIISLIFLGVMNFMPFICTPLVVAGWIWAYIYVWQNIYNTGWAIFFMIMLLLFGIDIWLTKSTYQNMLPLQRPPIVTTKGFAVGMWSITVCAFLADVAMLIHLFV